MTTTRRDAPHVEEVLRREIVSPDGCWIDLTTVDVSSLPSVVTRADIRLAMGSADLRSCTHPTGIIDTAA